MTVKFGRAPPAAKLKIVKVCISVREIVGVGRVALGHLIVVVELLMNSELIMVDADAPWYSTKVSVCARELVVGILFTRASKFTTLVIDETA